MAEERIIGFRIRIQGSEQIVKTIGELEKAVRDTNKQLKETEVGTDEYERLSQELANSKEQLQAVRKEQRAQIKEAEGIRSATGSYRQLNAQLIKARREFKELSREEREGQVGEQLTKQIQALDKELKDLDKSIGQSQRNVGNYASAFEGLGFDIKNLVAGLPALAIGAATTAIVEGTQAVIELSKEVNTLRGEFEQLTGLSGDDLDEFTNRVRAIALTFGVSVDEVAQSANALTKQLTGDFRESLDVIEEGFIIGANSSGELLDSTKEYATFIAEAGLSSRDFLRIINQSAKEGIFSDKGIDTIKEAVLSIRELPKTAEDALNAIGITGDEIADIIEAEGVGKAVARVSEQLNKFSDDSREVGQVLADIFKGAGEDAGVNFVKSLVTLGDEFGELEGAASDYAVFQRSILELNKELTRSQNDLSKELEGGNEQFQKTSITLRSRFNDILTNSIRNTKALIGSVSSLVGRFREFTEGTGIVATSLRRLSNIFTGFVKVVFAGSTQDLPAVFGGLGEVFEEFGNRARGVFETISFNAQLTGKRINLALSIRKETRERLRKDIEEFKDARPVADASGRSIGEAFNEGFQSVIAAREQRQEVEQIVKDLTDTTDLLDDTPPPPPVVDPDEIETQAGSIADLTDSISKLKEQIDKTKPSQEEYKRLNDELVIAEQKLADAIALREQALEKAIDGEVEQVESKNAEIIELNEDSAKKEIEARKFVTDSAKKLLKQQVDDERAAAAERQEIQREAIEAAFTLANELASTSFEVASQNAEREKETRLAQLDEEFQRRFELIEGNEEAELKLRQEFDKKNDQIDRQFRQREQQRAVAQAVVNGALAITKIIAETPDPTGTVTAIRIALAAALTAIQVATISSQKFQKGGLLYGPSHASGGIPAIVAGQRPVELEGGEAVINKRSTRMFKPLLSAINTAGGGVSFQTGGLTGAVPSIVQSTTNPFQSVLVLINEVREENKTTQQLALAVRQSVINLNVNLDTDELEGVQNTKVELDNLKTLS